ncbi:MAG TPA: hypothetical protein PLN52_06935 [Opitutaceae bacterium]|nr:hypothetical protein [Opitutaceae bacterium]
MKRSSLLSFALAILVPSLLFSAPTSPVDVRRIWDTGTHNAFTDLIRWRGAWWCTFREANDHVSPDGTIRVLTSKDGTKWDSAALITEAGKDLRDPKFSITPDDRLMIVCGRRTPGPDTPENFQSAVLFSKDGQTWTPPAIVLEGAWLWRVVWHDGMAYGAAYRARDAGGSRDPNAPDWKLNLHRSRDGLNWEVVSALAVGGLPNETTVRVLANGNMLAMVRREGGNRVGWFGVAKPPFTRWTWYENNYRFGGPNVIQLPDGRLIAGTRDYTPMQTSPDGKSRGSARTILGWLGGDDYTLSPFVVLPSAGDNSYPGMVWHEDKLWVTYYSSHEGKTSIYFTQLTLPADK